MLRKICTGLVLALVASAAVGQELGASVDTETRWVDETSSSTIEFRLQRGKADVERVLFINRSDMAVEIIDMNMHRIRTIKPRQSVDVSESVRDERHVAVSVGGSQPVYLELLPGMSVVAENVAEDRS